MSDREAFDAVIAKARKSVRRWESLSDLEQREVACELRENIARELASAYAEQRSGILYRLAIEDVRIAYRVAVWTRFDLELRRWRSDPVNGAAEDHYKRAKGQTGASGVVGDEVERIVSTRPRSPETWDPPLLRPTSHDIPDDWPAPGSHTHSTWVAELLRIRRENAGAKPVREPGEDE